MYTKEEVRKMLYGIRETRGELEELNIVIEMKRRTLNKEELASLREKAKIKRLEVRRLNNMLNILTVYERELVEKKYIEKRKDKDTERILNLSHTNLNRMNSLIVSSLQNFLNRTEEQKIV